MLPRFIYFTIPEATQTFGGHSSVVECCEKARGTFVLEWNGVNAWEYVFFKQPLTEAEAVAMACGDSGYWICIPPFDKRLIYKWIVKCPIDHYGSFPFLQLFLITCPNCEALQSNCEDTADPFSWPALYRANNYQPPGATQVNPCFRQDGGQDGTLFVNETQAFSCVLGPSVPNQNIIIRPVV